MTTAVSTAYRTAQAKQAVKILRDFYLEVLDPALRAKGKAVPEHPKYLLSVQRYTDRSNKALDAINNLESEVNSL